MLRRPFQNATMARKLLVVAVAMLGFGYALGPLYNAICNITGINVLALGDRNIPGATSRVAALMATALPTARARSSLTSRRILTIPSLASSR